MIFHIFLISNFPTPIRAEGRENWLFFGIGDNGDVWPQPRRTVNEFLMRNPFSSASLENFKKSSSEAVRRFPLATLAAVFATCLAFMTVHEAFGSEDAPFVMRLVASCAVAYFASVAMGTLSEGAGLAKTKSYALQAVSLAVAAAFFLVFDTESGYRGALTFALTFSVLIGFVFFAPYAKSPFAKKPGQDAYYGYFRRIAAVFVASAIL